MPPPMVQAQRLRVVEGEVGSKPPFLVLFIPSLVPQDVLVVDFLLILINSKVMSIFAALPANSAGTLPKSEFVAV